MRPGDIWQAKVLLKGIRQEKHRTVVMIGTE